MASNIVTRADYMYIVNSDEPLDNMSVYLEARKKHIMEAKTTNEAKKAKIAKDRFIERYTTVDAKGTSVFKCPEGVEMPHIYWAYNTSSITLNDVEGGVYTVRLNAKHTHEFNLGVLKQKFLSSIEEVNEYVNESLEDFRMLKEAVIYVGDDEAFMNIAAELKDSRFISRQDMEAAIRKIALKLANVTDADRFELDGVDFRCKFEYAMQTDELTITTSAWTSLYKICSIELSFTKGSEPPSTTILVQKALLCNPSDFSNVRVVKYGTYESSKKGAKGLESNVFKPYLRPFGNTNKEYYILFVPKSVFVPENNSIMECTSDITAAKRHLVPGSRKLFTFGNRNLVLFGNEHLNIRKYQPIIYNYATITCHDVAAASTIVDAFMKFLSQVLPYKFKYSIVKIQESRGNSLDGHVRHIYCTSAHALSICQTMMCSATLAGGSSPIYIRGPSTKINMRTNQIVAITDPTRSKDTNPINSANLSCGDMLVAKTKYIQANFGNVNYLNRYQVGTTLKHQLSYFTLPKYVDFATTEHAVFGNGLKGNLARPFFVSHKHFMSEYEKADDKKAFAGRYYEILARFNPTADMDLSNISASTAADQECYVRAYEPGSTAFVNATPRRPPTNSGLSRPIPGRAAPATYNPKTGSIADDIRKIGVRAIGFEDTNPAELGWSIINQSTLKNLVAGLKVFIPNMDPRSDPIVSDEYPITPETIDELRWVAFFMRSRIAVAINGRAHHIKKRMVTLCGVQFETEIATLDNYVGSHDLLLRRLMDY